jgi:hypothetical protein
MPEKTLRTSPTSPRAKQARAGTAAETALKRIRQQKAAAQKAAVRHNAWIRRFWKGELDRSISPQANWRDVGQALQKIWRGRRGCTCYWCVVHQDTPLGRRENYWLAVVADATRGNPSLLVKHIRRGLTPFDRNLLADTLAEILKKEPEQTERRGRPRRKWLRSCAHSAIRFYRDWKDANRRNGIHDWGHGDEMKDEACRLVIEIYGDAPSHVREEDHPPTLEELRELMDRPQARRS